MRDYLRSHPERAGLYGTLKRDLAVRHRNDNVSYMRGKDTFVKVSSRGSHGSRSLRDYSRSRARSLLNAPTAPTSPPAHVVERARPGRGVAFVGVDDEHSLPNFNASAGWCRAAPRSV
jgi:hypothetical protein